MDTIRNKKKRKESFVCCTCIPFTLAAPRHNAKRKHPEDRYGIILTRKLAIAERWAYGHMPKKKKSHCREIYADLQREDRERGRALAASAKLFRDRERESGGREIGVYSKE
jgi:hypothetical protein